MESYRKVTKDDIDLPRYCLFFIKEIMNKLAEADAKMVGDEVVIETSTTYPYCYDAIKLIMKTFERKRFYINTPSFKMTKNGDVKIYNYKWKLINLNNVDNLPF